MSTVPSGQHQVTIQDQVVDLIPALRAFARTFLSASHEGDDLVQETLFRALRSIDRFEEGTNLKSWLFTIMHNVFASQTRRVPPPRAMVDIEEVAAQLPGAEGARDRAMLAERVNCYNMAPITLGRAALVSQGAHLCAGTHDIASATFQLTASPITIGAGAWIAAEAFVGPGVEVGEGAVLGARGVAFRSLEAWTVYGGNPAKAIKPRVLRAER